MSHAKRRDANERDIIEALRSVGAAVQQLSDPGVPDLLVSFRGVLRLLEIKMPLGPRGGKREHREHEGGSGDLTAAQVKWWSSWSGSPAVIVRSVDEALAAIGADVEMVREAR